MYSRFVEGPSLIEPILDPQTLNTILRLCNYLLDFIQNTEACLGQDRAQSLLFNNLCEGSATFQTPPV